MSSLKRPLDAMDPNRSLIDSERSVDLGDATDLDQPNALKETILDLTWSVRNQIIDNLYGHTSFLIQKIGDKLKAERMKKNFELIQTLMNLPAANYQSDEPKNKKVKLDADSAQPNEIILDLSWADRDLVVDNLMKNHHAAVLFSKQISRSVKDNLAKENNHLVTVLTNLRVRTVEEDEVMIDEEATEKASTPTEEQVPLKEPVADDALDKSLNKSSPAENEESKSLIMDIAQIKKEFEEFVPVVREIGKFIKEGGLREKTTETAEKNEKVEKNEKAEKNETTFTHKVSINKLDDKKSTIYSPGFQCCGIQWFTKLNVKTKDTTDYLSVFIQPDLKGNACEVVADFQLRNENEANVIKKSLNHTFSKSSPRGFSDFIEMSTLLDKQSGFVNEKGEIELDVYLKVNKSPIEI